MLLPGPLACLGPPSRPEPVRAAWSRNGGTVGRCCHGPDGGGSAGRHPSPSAIEEAASMTATESTATSLESLLGTVGEAMSGEVVVLHADTPVDVALRRLEHTQVSGAPVVDHGRVVGVVTLRDLLVPVLADRPVLTT